tara:strand:+ start:58 stop:366 length:309 start_codon:yes stop_codon:yes gene_type:complete
MSTEITKKHYDMLMRMAGVDLEWECTSLIDHITYDTQIVKCHIYIHSGNCIRMHEHFCDYNKTVSITIVNGMVVSDDTWARLRAGCDKYIDTVKFINNLKGL